MKCQGKRDPLSAKQLQILPISCQVKIFASTATAISSYFFNNTRRMCLVSRPQPRMSEYVMKCQGKRDPLSAKQLQILPISCQVKIFANTATAIGSYFFNNTRRMCLVSRPQPRMSEYVMKCQGKRDPLSAKQLQILPISCQVKIFANTATAIGPYPH